MSTGFGGEILHKLSLLPQSVSTAQPTGNTRGLAAPGGEGIPCPPSLPAHIDSQPEALAHADTRQGLLW